MSIKIVDVEYIYVFFFLLKKIQCFRVRYSLSNCEDPYCFLHIDKYFYFCDFEITLDLISKGHSIMPFIYCLKRKQLAKASF